MTEVLRPHAEVEYADELQALRATDDKPRPPAWQMSPSAVVTYLLGGKAGTGLEPAAPDLAGDPLHNLAGEVAGRPQGAHERRLVTRGCRS